MLQTCCRLGLLLVDVRAAVVGSTGFGSIEGSTNDLTGPGTQLTMYRTESGSIAGPTHRKKGHEAFLSRNISVSLLSPFFIFALRFADSLRLPSKFVDPPNPANPSLVRRPPALPHPPPLHFPSAAASSPSALRHFPILLVYRGAARDGAHGRPRRQQMVLVDEGHGRLLQSMRRRHQPARPCGGGRGGVGELRGGRTTR